MAIDMSLHSTYQSNNRFAVLSSKQSSAQKQSQSQPPPQPHSITATAASKKSKTKPLVPSSNATSGSSSSTSLSDLGPLTPEKTNVNVQSVSARAVGQGKHEAQGKAPLAPIAPRAVAKKAKTKASAAKVQVEKAVTPPIDWEVPRKTLHASIGLLVLLLNELQPRSIKPLLQILITGLIAVFTVDIFRLRSPRFAKLYETHLGLLMRESEKTQINGVIWYLTGVIFTLLTYPRDVAVVAILTLSWSDTTASTIGRLWGRYTPPLPEHVPGIKGLKFAKRKSLAGFLAALVTGAAIGIGFYGSQAGSKAGAEWAVLQGGHRVWGIAGTSAVIGLGGAVVEALDLGFDDNLTLPILSGAVIWAWFILTNFILSL